MAYEVTIGIPVYNVEQYVHRMMDSALAQTYQNIEFLVLDDCGTDSSMDIIREYQQQHPRGKDIRIVRQPQNGGLGRARNRIIEEARGRYLYHLDADDAIAPNTIELLHTEAERYDADIVYGSYRRIEEFDGETKNTDFCYQHQVFLEENAFADRVYSDYSFLQATTWNFLIKTEIYIRNNIRHKAVNFWEDLSTTIDLPCYIGRAVLLPDITYYYFCRYGTLSNFGKREHIGKSEIQKTINAMSEVKNSSILFVDRPYFQKRMFKVMLTHFYMACSILQQKDVISPSFTNNEIRCLMKYPLPLSCFIGMDKWKAKNLFLCIIGSLPVCLSILVISILGKWKKLL